MLTPQRITDKRFEKSSLFGYRPDDVDAFLTEISADFEALIKEKADLESKLAFLAEKLQEYRNDEESLRAAMVGAQKMGDSVVKDAKNQAEQVIRDATVQAAKLAESYSLKIEKEKITLANLQKKVANFKNQLLTLYKHHLEQISSLPSQPEGDLGLEAVPDEPVVEAPAPVAVPTPAAEPAAPEEPVPATESAFKMNYYTGTAQPAEEAPAATPAAAPQEPKESRFTQLKFGTGYDISRDK